MLGSEVEGLEKQAQEWDSGFLSPAVDLGQVSFLLLALVPLSFWGAGTLFCVSVWGLA